MTVSRYLRKKIYGLKFFAKSKIVLMEAKMKQLAGMILGTVLMVTSLRCSYAVFEPFVDMVARPFLFKKKN